MEKQEQATAVEQQYLWAVGLDTDAFPPDALIGDRYRVISSQIVVDTDAYSLPELPLEFQTYVCLLYTSPSPRDGLLSRMPSSA